MEQARHHFRLPSQVKDHLLLCFDLHRCLHHQVLELYDMVLLILALFDEVVFAAVVQVVDV